MGPGEGPGLGPGLGPGGVGGFALGLYLVVKKRKRKEGKEVSSMRLSTTALLYLHMSVI